MPKGRSSWCSQACVDEYLSRSSGEYIRRQVYQRDHGICAICGCDADSEYRAWRDAMNKVIRMAGRLIQSYRLNVSEVRGRMEFRRESEPSGLEMKRFRSDLIGRYAPGRWTSGRNSGWDADHIVPVSEGGGECDLDNYRTLCHPCHKNVTAELAGRLAKARREQKRNDRKEKKDA